MKKIFALLLALSMLFALAACGGSSAPATQAPATEAPAAEEPAAEEPAAEEPAEENAGDSDLSAIQAKGTLVIGVTDFAPMDYKDEDGEWIGFDADLAKAFAESIGVTAEFVEINWDNKVLELNAGSIDCVWNGMTLNDEVLNTMSCSVPYANNAQVVVLKADAADQYPDTASMADLTVAVEAGSAGEAEATAAGLTTLACESQAAALMEVGAGTSDACVIDLLMAGAMIGEGTSYPDLTVTVRLNESEEYGVGFRQGSDLVDAFNAFYADAYADGTVMELAKTYGVNEAIVEP